MNPILVDTSVVVRLFHRSSADHFRSIQALRILRQRNERAYSCAQVQIEAWVVMTRPKDVNGLGFTASEAARNLELVSRLLPCLAEPPNVVSLWREVVLKHGVLGKGGHDARLVALMAASGISRILTLNVADFTRFKDIEVLSPAQVLASAP